MLPNPETPFTARVREVLVQSSLRCPGFHPTGLLFLLARCRGDFAPIAARLMHRSDPSTGLDRLMRRDALDLSIEALVLDERWAGLFDPSDRCAAGRRLAQARTAPPTALPARRGPRRRSPGDAN